MSSEAQDVLDKIGTGMRLVVPHDRRVTPRLMHPPARAAWRKFEDQDVPWSVVDELLQCNLGSFSLLSRLTPKMEHDRFGYLEVGFSSELGERAAIYACTQ